MMDAAGRERARERATYAERTAGKMDAHVRKDEVRQLARDALALLDALDAAETRLAAVEALADQWAESPKQAYEQDAARDLRAVLAGERIPG